MQRTYVFCKKNHKEKMTWMKCTCGRKAERKSGLKFNGHQIDGWVCKKCGVVAYDPIQTEKILLLNKLKNKKFNLKLSQVRSNLILRIPKDVSDVLGLKKGSHVEFELDKDYRMVIKGV